MLDISNTVRSTALKMVEEQEQRGEKECVLPLIDIQNDKNKLPLQPIYYERLDATTLKTMIEVTKENDRHFVIVFTIQSDHQQGVQKDEQEEGGVIKSKDIKKWSSLEFRYALENASKTVEEADRLHYIKTNRAFTTTTTTTTTVGTEDITNEDQETSSDAPNDYWGDWSSDDDEEEEEEHEKESIEKGRKTNAGDDSIEDSEEDSEDDYYNRWSKEPGTLTPGLNEREEDEKKEGRTLQPFDVFETKETTREIIMDKETAALSELTTILTNTIPNPTKRPLNHTINPLPKVVIRSMLIDSASDEHGIFLHNLRNLIVTAKELGYKGNDIVDIVGKLVNE